MRVPAGGSLDGLCYPADVRRRTLVSGGVLLVASGLVASYTRLGYGCLSESAAFVFPQATQKLRAAVDNERVGLRRGVDVREAPQPTGGVGYIGSGFLASAIAAAAAVGRLVVGSKNSSRQVRGCNNSRLVALKAGDQIEAMKKKGEDDDEDVDADFDDSDDDELDIINGAVGYEEDDDDIAGGDEENDYTMPEKRAVLEDQSGDPKMFRRILYHIRSRTYRDALTMLEFMPWLHCKQTLECLKDAANNAVEQEGWDKSRLWISRCWADEANRKKRMQRKCKGRTVPKRTRRTNLHMYVAEYDPSDTDLSRSKLIIQNKNMHQNPDPLRRRKELRGTRDHIQRDMMLAKMELEGTRPILAPLPHGINGIWMYKNRKKMLEDREKAKLLANASAPQPPQGLLYDA